MASGIHARELGLSDAAGELEDAVFSEKLEQLFKRYAIEPTYTTRKFVW